MPAWRRAGWDIVAWSRADLDVTRGDDVLRAVRDQRVEAVAHLAAWTDVDGAEAHPDEALHVNEGGTRNVAEACRAAGARCLLLSSDYVFAGDGHRPVSPEEAPRPHGAYAVSKFAAERAVRSAGEWIVARTGWVYGPGGKNFVDTMRAKARAAAPVRVVSDQHGAPTSTRLLASVLFVLLASGSRGIWHVAPSGDATWLDVAQLVYRSAGADESLVTGCTTRELGRPAPRPAYAVLETSATERLLGTRLPPWQRDVRSYVASGELPASAWEVVHA